MATQESVPLNRNCKNPTCEAPLFAETEFTRKVYCSTRCRVISYALRELKKDGYVVVPWKS